MIVFVYFLVVDVYMIRILYTVYFNRVELESASETRITCAILKGVEYADECVTDGFSFGLGWYKLIGAVFPFAVLGSMILSCHEKNFHRWKIMILSIIDICLCRKNRNNEKTLAQFTETTTTTIATSKTKNQSNGSDKDKKQNDIELTVGDITKEIST